MKLISTLLHGVLDYTVSLLMILAPWLFRFDYAGPESWFLPMLGIGGILMSMNTAYELGLTEKLSMRMHLSGDLILGVVLAVAPFLGDYSHNAKLVYLSFASIAIIVVFLTDPVPGRTSMSRRPGIN